MPAFRPLLLRLLLVVPIVSATLSGCYALPEEAQWLLAGDGMTVTPPPLTRTPTATVTPTATATVAASPTATPSALPSPTRASTFLSDDCLCPGIGPSERAVESLPGVTGLICRYRWEADDRTSLVTLEIPRRGYADDPDGARAFARACEEHAGWNEGKQGATTHRVEEPRRVTWLTSVDDTAGDRGWRYGLRVAHLNDTVAVLHVNSEAMTDEAAVAAALDEAEACALSAIDAYDER